MRKRFSTTHYGPESLEDKVVDYIVQNQDLYDVQTSVDVWETTFSQHLVGSFCWKKKTSLIASCVPPPQDVIAAINVNPRILFPPEVDLVLISGLIREVCTVAFAMQTLDPPLDLAYASDGEVYNGSKLVVNCKELRSCKEAAQFRCLKKIYAVPLI